MILEENLPTLDSMELEKVLYDAQRLNEVNNSVSFQSRGSFCSGSLLRFYLWSATGIVLITSSLLFMWKNHSVTCQMSAEH